MDKAKISVDYSTSVNTFTRNITATIKTKNITDNEFFTDIISLKANQLTKQDFISKYSLLFDGTYSNYGLKSKGKTDYESKAIESFLGSYRRSINPKNYKKVKNIDVRTFNTEFRNKTYISIPKSKKVIKKTIKQYNRKREYFSHISLNGFAKKELSKYQDVRQIKHFGTYRVQEIQLLIYYDVYNIDSMKIMKIKKDTLTEKQKEYVEYKKIDNLGNIIYKDMAIIFGSGLTKEKTLQECFDVAYNKFITWFMKLSQSKMYVQLNKVFTEIYRKIDV